MNLYSLFSRKLGNADTFVADVPKRPLSKTPIKLSPTYPYSQITTGKLKLFILIS